MRNWQIERADERRRLNQAKTEANCLYCGLRFTYIPILPGVSQPYCTIECRKFAEAEAQSESGGGSGGDIG